MPKDQTQLDTDKQNADQAAKDAAENAKQAKEAEEKKSRAALSALSEKESVLSELEVAQREEKDANERALRVGDVEVLVGQARTSALEDGEDEEPKPLAPQREKDLRARFQREAKEALEKQQLAAKKVRELEATLREKEETAKRLVGELEEAEKLAKKAAEDALRLEILAADAAEAATIGVKKVLRVLAWDGIHDLDGKCNQRYAPSPIAGPRANRRAEVGRVPAVLHVRPVGAEETKSYSSTVRTMDKVSVRLINCEQEFAPIKDRVLVRVNLKRAAKIKSLLLRVFSAANALVYQEVLDTTAIDALPELDNDARGTAETEDARLTRAAANAMTADGPFKVQVWVSSDAASFLKPGGGIIDPANHPTEVLGSTMHEKSVFPAPPAEDNDTWRQIAKKLDDKKTDVDKDAVGYNQIRVKGVRQVTVVMPNVLTKQDDARGNRPILTQTQEVDTLLAGANAHLGAPRNGEIRVFMMPEWNFQAPGRETRHLTRVEADQVVTEMQRIGNIAANKPWVLIPGTILYYEDIAATGLRAVLNRAVIFHDGAEKFRYYKQLHGSDTNQGGHKYVAGVPMRPVTIDVAAAGNEKRRKKLDKNPPVMPDSLLDRIYNDFLASRNAPVVTQIQAGSMWGVRTGSVAADHKFFVLRKLAKGDKTIRLARREVFATDVPAGNIWQDLFGTLARNTYETRNFVEIDHVKYGFEICADHPYGRAVTSYRNGDGRGAGATAGVDIHLVTSCDTNTYPQNSVARDGGLFFQADGGGKGKWGARVTRATDITTVGAAFLPRWDNPALRANTAHNHAAAFANLPTANHRVGTVDLTILRSYLVDP